MAKRTIKINIKLPAGVTANKELEAKATEAANAAVADAVSDLVQAQKLAKRLAAEGIQITAEELMNRKVGNASKAAKPGPKPGPKPGTKPAKKAGARKRVVLSDEQRAQLKVDLKTGMKIQAAAKKYGISPATVSNIKTSAGLTTKRK